MTAWRSFTRLYAVTIFTAPLERRLAGAWLSDDRPLSCIAPVLRSCFRAKDGLAKRDPARRVLRFQQKRAGSDQPSLGSFRLLPHCGIRRDKSARQESALRCCHQSRGQCAGACCQIDFRFGCGADIPVCRFRGLSSPRIPRQTISFGRRSWKTSQPAGSKARPAI